MKLFTTSYSLNVFLDPLSEEEENKYLDSEKFLKCGTDKTIELLRGKAVAVGLDLSSGGDLTSLAIEYKYLNENNETKYFI